MPSDLLADLLEADQGDAAPSPAPVAGGSDLFADLNAVANEAPDGGPAPLSTATDTSQRYRPGIIEQAINATRAAADIPRAVITKGGAGIAEGIGGVGAMTGTMDPASVATLRREADRLRGATNTSAIPGAETLTDLGGAMVPFVAGAPGVAIGAGAMAGGGYLHALDEGATEGQATTSGVAQGVVGAALPGAGRLVQPAVAAIASRAAALVAPKIGMPAARVVQETLESALQGGGAGAAIAGTDAATTAQYDTDLAIEKAKAIPESALMGTIGGAMAQVGPSAVRGVREQRAETARRAEQQVVDQGNMETALSIQRAATPGVDPAVIRAQQEVDAAAKARAQETLATQEQAPIAAERNARIDSELAAGKAEADALTAEARAKAVADQEAEQAAATAKAQEDARLAEERRKLAALPDEAAADAVARQEGEAQDVAAADREQLGESAAERLAILDENRTALRRQLDETKAKIADASQAREMTTDAKRARRDAHVAELQHGQSIDQDGLVVNREGVARPADAALAQTKDFQQELRTRLRADRDKDRQTKQRRAVDLAQLRADQLRIQADLDAAESQHAELTAATARGSRIEELRTKARSKDEERAARAGAPPETPAPAPADGIDAPSIPTRLPPRPQDPAGVKKGPIPLTAEDVAALPREDRVAYLRTATTKPIASDVRAAMTRLEAKPDPAIASRAKARLDDWKATQKPENVPRGAAEPVVSSEPASRPTQKPSARAGSMQEAAPRLPAEHFRRTIAELPISKRTPGLADALNALVDARARAVGKTADQWIGDRISEVRTQRGEPSLNQDALDQLDPQRGFTVGSFTEMRKAPGEGRNDWRFNQTVKLKDGTHLSGITTKEGTTLFGYDKNGEAFTISTEKLNPSQIVMDEHTSALGRRLHDQLVRQENTLDQAVHPKGESLAFDDLLRQWRKANGDRTPVRGGEEWRKLEQEASQVDARRGNTFDQGDTLNDARVVRRGAVEFAKDGRAIIHAFEAADQSTALHELGHVFRRDLSDGEQQVAGKWAGARRGEDGVLNWGRAAEEKFARGFERYMRDGVAPTPALKSVFQKFAGWLREVYRAVTGSAIDIKLSPEIRGVFDRMFQEGQQSAPVSKEATDAGAGGRGPAAGESRAEPAAAPGRLAPVAPVGDRGAPTAPGAAADRPAPASVAEAPKPVAAEAVAPKAKAEKPPKLTAEQQATADAARPDLANPAVKTGVREIVDAARAKLEPPEVRRAAEVKTDADALLADGEKTKALRSKVRAGEILSDTETVAFRDLLDREGQRAIERGEFADIVADTQGYTRGGTELGRAMAARHDQLLSPEERTRASVNRAILMPSQRVSGELRDIADRMKDASPAKKRVLEKQLAKLQEQEAERLAKFSRRMTGLGFDLKDMKTLYQEEAKAAAVVHESQIDKADAWDATYEWWISSILSGPKTQITNTSGNGLNFLAHYGWEKPLEAIIGQIPGLRGHGPSIGELAAVYKTILSGESGRFGLEHMLTAWSAQRPVLEAELATGRRLNAAQTILARNDAGGKFNDRPPAMNHLPGRIMRSVSLRPIMATDEFFKSFAAKAEVAGEAYRRASEAGFKAGSEEHELFMRSEMDDLGSSSWAVAMEKAKDLTFQKDPGGIAKFVGGIRKVPYIGYPSKYVLPFINTLINLIGRGAKMAPVTAQANIARKIVQQGLWMAKPGIRGATPYARTEFIQDFATSTIGLLATGVMGAWFNGETKDGLPLFTGTDERFVPAKDQTVPSKSIYLFGNYYDYSRLDPFSTVLAATADLFQGMKKDSPKDAISQAASTAKYMVIDKSFMQTLGDLNKAMGNAEGGTNTAAKMLRGILVGFIPNVIRQPVGAYQEETKDQQVHARAELSSGAWWREQGRLAAGQAFGGLPFVPKVDLWGREVDKDTERLGSDALWRLLSPVGAKDGRPSNLYEQTIWNWNKTAAKPQWPGYPRDYVEIKKPNGEKARVYYTSDEYHTMMKARGKAVLEELRGWRPTSATKPTDEDFKRIYRAFGKATTDAAKPFRDKAALRGTVVEE